MAHPFDGDASYEESDDEIDDVGDKCPESEESNVDLRIPKNPSKEKDRPGDMPENQCLPAVESEIGQRVGNRVLPARNMFEPMWHASEEGTRFFVEHLQWSTLDPKPTLELSDQKEAVGSQPQEVGLLDAGEFQPRDDRAVFGDVVGGDADGLAGTIDFDQRFALDPAVEHGSNRGRTGVTPRGSIGI